MEFSKDELEFIKYCVGNMGSMCRYLLSCSLFKNDPDTLDKQNKCKNLNRKIDVILERGDN